MTDYWTQYGFKKGIGDPVGLTALIPATGLIKALLERLQYVHDNGLTWEEIEALQPVDYLSQYITVINVNNVSNPSDFAVWYDYQIMQTLGYYVNYFDENKPFWTWNTLCEAVAKASKCDIVHADDILCPELSSIWARQRYIAVNFLKMIRMDVEVSADMVYGNVHTGVPSSPQEAVKIALSEKSEKTENRLSIGDYRDDIYGPSHGWREGSYCVNIQYCTGFKPIIPAGVDSSGITLEVQAHNTFDSMGTGLHIGSNALEFDNKGRIDWPLSTKSPDGSHPLPVLNVDVSYGWTGRCMYSAEPYFHFFHDCDYLK